MNKREKGKGKRENKTREREGKRERGKERREERTKKRSHRKNDFWRKGERIEVSCQSSIQVFKYSSISQSFF